MAAINDLVHMLWKEIFRVDFWDSDWRKPSVESGTLHRVCVLEQPPRRAYSGQGEEWRKKNLPEQGAKGQKKAFPREQKWDLLKKHSLPSGWEALALAARQDFQLLQSGACSVSSLVPLQNQPLGAVEFSCVLTDFQPAESARF